MSVQLEINWKTGEVFIQNTSTDLAIAAKDQKAQIDIPERYQSYLKVFSEQEATRMPINRPYDLSIKLDETFIPKQAPVFQLSEDEDKEL